MHLSGKFGGKILERAFFPFLHTRLGEERKKCNLKPCAECKLYEWTPWSACSISCMDSSHKLQVFGTKRRTRQYDEVDPSDPMCDKTSMTETNKWNICILSCRRCLVQVVRVDPVLSEM